jgi:uncharacterized protein YbaA (DUF1428 family)
VVVALGGVVEEVLIFTWMVYNNRRIRGLVILKKKV